MKWFYDLDVKRKLIVGFAPLILLALMLGLVGYKNVGQMTDQMVAMHDDQMLPILEIGKAEVATTEIVVASKALALDTDGNNSDATAEDLKHNREVFEASLKHAMAADLDATNEVRLEDVAAKWDKFVPDIERVIAKIESDANDFDEAEAAEFEAELAEIVTQLAAAADYEEERAAGVTAAVESLHRLALYELLGASGLALLFGIGIAIFVARTVGRPVQQLEEAATAVTNGNHDVRVEVDTEDEFGRLSDAFNQMVESIQVALQQVRTQQEHLQESVQTMLVQMDRFADGDLTARLDADRYDGEIGRLYEGFNCVVQNMRDMINRVSDATQVASAAAGQISSSADQLAAAGQEQAAQSDEVAAAMEEMSRTIVDNAQSTTRTASLAEESGKTARANGRVVLETVDKMRDIGSVVETSAETIDRLGASSAEIGDIVATIDDIADQTNLLALNAAIEAARAGEHGSGFAVVADEVRQLAERTAQATSKIEDMINTVQAETSEAVSAMEQGRDEVESGIQLADEAGRAFEEIVANVEQVAQQVESIATATEEQSTTTEQISRNVESISTVSAESAQGVNEVAQSADQMDRLTADLNEMMDQFRLETSEAPAQRAQTPSDAAPATGDGVGVAVAAPAAG